VQEHTDTAAIEFRVRCFQPLCHLSAAEGAGKPARDNTRTNAGMIDSESTGLLLRRPFAGSRADVHHVRQPCDR
jgi:hypothetical protein